MHKIKESKQKTVTFDFDDTLLNTKFDEDWGSIEEGPNEKMIRLLKRYND